MKINLLSTIKSENLREALYWMVRGPVRWFDSPKIKSLQPPIWVRDCNWALQNRQFVLKVESFILYALLQFDNSKNGKINLCRLTFNLRRHFFVQTWSLIELLSELKLFWSLFLLFLTLFKLILRWFQDNLMLTYLFAEFKVWNYSNKTLREFIRILFTLFSDEKF